MEDVSVKMGLLGEFLIYRGEKCVQVVKDDWKVGATLRAVKHGISHKGFFITCQESGAWYATPDHGLGVITADTLDEIVALVEQE